MRVVVSGGAGFVGSHLVERLVAEGHEVVVLDDLSTGSTSHLRDCERVIEFHVGCVTDARRVAEVVRGADRVVHLASTVGVERVAKEPERTRHVIEDGTACVLARCAMEGIPLVLVSSSEIYGFTPPTPVTEDDVPPSIDGTAPRLSYARAKLAADRMGLRAFDAGAKVLVVRPFNIVGPRQSEDGGAVLPRFVLDALAGDDLVVHGDGTQRRCFLDVRDAADVLLRLVARERFPFAAINLGGRTEASMIELARMVTRRLKSASRVRLSPPPLARGGVEIARRVPNLVRLETLLGSIERHSLEDAVDALACERQSHLALAT